MDAGDMGGITNSLLGRFLLCRERFRLFVVDGLRKPHEFSHKVEYGNMWHTCEEAYAKTIEWLPSLIKYCQQLCKQYPTQQQQIDHWFNVCRTQFPIYVEYWRKHKDVTQRTPLLQEQVFHVPYQLPSGRVVYLRGKWDSVDLVGKVKNASVRLKENKTKGNIIEQQLKTQLHFDCQTMIYFVALQKDIADPEGYLAAHEEKKGFSRYVGLTGLTYNVVRRPLSGGKGTIVRHKPSKKNPQGESKEHFYSRVADVIKEDPSSYFMRWGVDISAEDVKRFEQRFLIPILEQLCDWWTAMEDCGYDPWNNKPSNQGRYAVHWQHPYGLYSVLNEGGTTGLDEHLATGSKIGLEHATTLFDELR